MGFLKQDKQKAIQEVASEILKGMKHLIRNLSHQPSHLNIKLNDVTILKFNKLISLLNQTNHTQFKCALVYLSSPVYSLNLSDNASSSSIPHLLPPNLNIFASTVVVVVHHVPPMSMTLNFRKPHNKLLSCNAKSVALKFSKDTFSISSNSSFMSSTITSDDNVFNIKIFLVSMSLVFKK